MWMAATTAVRLFPSRKAWLSATDSKSAATFSKRDPYASSPKTVCAGRPTAEASRPGSRSIPSPTKLALISASSSTVGYRMPASHVRELVQRLAVHLLGPISHPPGDFLAPGAFEVIADQVDDDVVDGLVGEEPVGSELLVQFSWDSHGEHVALGYLRCLPRCGHDSSLSLLSR